MKQINLTAERLLQDAKEFSIDPSSESYIKSYSVFLKFFQDNGENMDDDKLIILSHIIYSWMPTIITLHTTIQSKEKEEINILTDVIKILDKARKDDQLLNIQELSILKECINNSMVGSSKMLHFTAPEKYPIWDSRILRYVTTEKTSSVTEKFSTYGIDNPALYLEYTNKLQEIAASDKYKEIKSAFYEKIEGSKLKDYLNNDLSRIRIMEMIMFEADKKK